MNLKSFEEAFHKEYNSLADNAKRKREGTQVKLLEENIKQTQKHHDVTKKLTLVIAFAVIAMVIGIGFFVLNIDNFTSSDLTGNQLRSGYYVENLKGDTLDVSFSWRVPDNRELVIEVINAEDYPEKIPLLEKVILSDEIVDVDNEDSTVPNFVGWKGAMDSIDIDETQITIPRDLQFLESGNGAGDITITLSNLANGDGLSGITKISVDEASEQILKARITIYKVDSLSDDEFITIVRHEFGHALGLPHSSTQGDLMYSTIQPGNSLISQCDVDALIMIYNSEKIRQVECDN